jgi:alkylation response protein AidB-like acyl-CoA dehydrogenase
VCCHTGHNAQDVCGRPLRSLLAYASDTYGTTGRQADIPAAGRALLRHRTGDAVEVALRVAVVGLRAVRAALRPHSAGEVLRAGRESAASAALLALHLGRLKDQGRIRPSRSASASSTTSGEALDIAPECRTVLGANGISSEYAPLGHANNLESVLTYEGTSEIHTPVIGQAVTGQAAYR